MERDLPMRVALRLTLLAFAAVASGAGPAAALDCARASTPVENAICADPATAANDDAMGKAYDSLKARLPAADAAALVISQGRWLQRRTDICLARSGPAVGSCFSEETEKRRAFLAGDPVSGPGAAQRLAPVFIQHVGAPGEYDLDVNAVKFADPQLAGEKLFNARVDALLREVPKIDQTGVRQNVVYSYILDVSASFASPELISAHVSIYDFSGGAHGDSSTSNFAIDLTTGKELNFSDLFAAPARQPLESQCLAEIWRQKHGNGTDAGPQVVSLEDQKRTIEQGVGDLTRWSLFATGAKVTFDPYALGAYVEGSYSCEFSAETLRPLLKLDYLSEAAAPQADR